MNREELITKRNQIDKETSKWMGIRKNVNLAIANNAIFAMGAIDKMICDLDKEESRPLPAANLPPRNLCFIQ